MIVYLNNAATTYPKPEAVIEAVRRALAEPPAEPGRSAGDEDPTTTCREALARLFGVPEACRVVLTPSATYALNLVLRGHLLHGGNAHVITTALEHNSVLRPLEHLRREGCAEVTHLQPESDGRIDPGALADQLRDDTRLIALTHASNVTGCIQPVEAMAQIAAGAGIPLLVDASQSAGAVELDVGRLPGRVFVAFAGHKGLFGPSGVGGLIVPDDRLPQTFVGGTGVRSESLVHPAELPIRHEAGTMNLPGIAGLAEGARFVLARGVGRLGTHRHRLVHALRNCLFELPGCRLSPLAGGDGRAGIFSLALDGWDPNDLTFLLHESFGIQTRGGLHCAPLAHRTWAAPAAGSVRLSVAAFNTEEDARRVGEALHAVGATCTK